MAPQTISPNRPKLKKALALSTLLHATVLSAFVFLLYSDSVYKAAGVGSSGFIINVELVGFSPPFVRRGKGEVEAPSPSTPPQPSPDPSTSLRTGKGEGGNGGEGGASKVLQQIRNKIERAKFYPLIAKRSRTEGSPLIEFKIKSDGSLEYATLKQTSGSSILDSAALNTVREAAPYPFYPEPIALNIHYSLRQ